MSRKESKWQAFMSGEKPKPHQIDMIDLKRVIAYYKIKYGISIVRNGDHILKESTDERIKQLKTPSNKYAVFLALRFNDQSWMGKFNGLMQEININDSNNKPLYEWLLLNCSEFISNGAFKNNLTEAEILDLNNRIEQAADSIRLLLDDLISKEISLLPYLAPDKEAAISEMLQICASLNGDEAVGYVYTGGRNIALPGGSDHYEVFILQRDSITRPVRTPGVDTLAPSHFGNLKTYLPLMKDGEATVAPQSDMYSCGTLGVLYLKKLLEDNAKGFKEDSLRLTLYTSREEKTSIFIPAATTLHYSQSRKYIQLLIKTVNDTSENSLENLLKKSMQFAEQINDTKTLKDNAQQLMALGEFRKKWNEAVEADLKKHGVMQDNQGNQFLLYRQHGLLQKSRSGATALPEKADDQSHDLGEDERLSSLIAKVGIFKVCTSSEQVPADEVPDLKTAADELFYELHEFKLHGSSEGYQTHLEQLRLIKDALMLIEETHYALSGKKELPIDEYNKILAKLTKEAKNFIAAIKKSTSDNTLYQYELKNYKSAIYGEISDYEYLSKPSLFRRT